MKLAFRTIKDHSLLIILFREVVQRKLKENREYLYRSGFLLKYVYEAFEMMRAKLRLIDTKSLIYLTGIDFTVIASHVNTANEDIFKARIDYEISPEKLEDEENKIKDALKSKLLDYLEDNNYNLFYETSSTQPDFHIYKLGRVINNCTLQSSYSKTVRFVASTICRQLAEHQGLLEKLGAETIRKSLKSELLFWKFVTQSRLGFNVYKFIGEVSRTMLDDLCSDRKLGDKDYANILNNSHIKLRALVCQIDSCDTKFKVDSKNWPSNFDFFVLYGNSSCVRRTFEGIPLEDRPSKNIILVETENKATTLNEDKIIAEELTKLGFSSVINVSVDRLLKILENMQNKRICFVLGFELCHKETFSSLHHNGAAETLQQIIASCKRLNGVDNIEVVLVGQSYKLVDFNFGAHPQMFFSTLSGDDVTRVLTEDGVVYKK
ncbi:MAG: hypothetical protein Q6358_01800 [Candidatus Brocadiales bacterium]|nr:hypothetical protein [Candidatus Brocadiales bacterium]